MEFQSLQQKLQRGPCCYYSYESWAIQITPWVSLNSNRGVPAEVRERARGLTAKSGERGHRRRGLGWGKRKGGRGEPLGGLGAREEDRSYGVDSEQRLAELGYGGGVVPVGIGRGGVDG